jgi:tetratricopeptide (TPR) repeat protein
LARQTEVSDLSFTVHPAPVLEGIVLFHIGLCYRFQAEKHRRANRPYWTEAKNYFQECIDVLERAGRSDAVGIFINQLGEVLQHLEDWEALGNLAIKARRLHKKMENSAVNLAQDYGFLAIVALEQKKWQGAKEWALVALDVLNSNLETTGQGTPVKSQHQGLYLLILAEAQSQLGEIRGGDRAFRAGSLGNRSLLQPATVFAGFRNAAIALFSAGRISRSISN